MSQYVVRRLLLMVPTVLVVSFIIFALVNLMPGDVVLQRLADSPSFRDEDAAELRHKLGIDQPIYEQYVRWLGGLVRLDLGESLWTDRPVATEIRARLPVTIELAVLTFAICSAFAIAVGVISAVKQDTIVDHSVRVLSIFALAVPNFFIATLVILFGSKYFDYIPPSKYIAFVDDPIENLKQFLLPAATLAIGISGALMRMTRSAMLEVLRQDYIRTARAKGLGGGSVVVRHALKNALIPVITLMGALLATLIGGAVIIESIFNLRGLGRLMLDSINTRDLTMVQGIALFLGTVFVLVNLLVDLSYAWLDPRVKY